MIGRPARALACTLLGWLAAWAATLPFQLQEVGVNAGHAFILSDLGQGLGLWVVFTLGVCAAAGLLLILPASALVPWSAVRRYRWQVILAGAAFGIYNVGNRLGTWIGLVEDSGGNPFASRLFWMYSIFAAVFTVVTVLSYTRTPR